LALVGGTGNTGIFVDTSAPRWTYNASTGTLESSTGSVQASVIIATTGFNTGGSLSATQIYSNNYFASDSSSPLIIKTPFDDGVGRPIRIGDYDGFGNGTVITIDDAASKIEFSAANIDAYGSLNVKNSGYLTFYDADASNYVAFRGPTALAANTLWTLPSADGSANQVLTTNGSGTLSWSTPSGGGGSSVTSFNGLTGAVTGVSRVNGLTGGLTFAAGTGITFTTSGNTITISSTASGGGGISRSISTITTSTSAGASASYDYVFIGATSGNINLTLPTAVSNTNRYSVKQSNAVGTLTLLTTSSQTIDGLTAFALNKQYQAVDLISDNANWHIL